ncbi:hypothetical protein [Actinoplanes sp. GCM10030250]|uniref:hypothetical protein n=1 Tax=Actinoplanes sp. GCM10030250 TaxID=3273376 RepID=UPI0036228EB7
MSTPADRLWTRVKEWWSSKSEPLVDAFFADGGAPVRPYRGYLRLWLSEMSLAQDRRSATDRYPALQASVRLSFAGSPGTVLPTVIRPPQGQEGPGIRRDIPLTALLPYAGGTVDLQVALLDVAGNDDLAMALDIVGEFSSLLTPPLSTVAAVAGKVANGINRIDERMEAGGQRPVLALQRSLTADAQGLQPGHLVGALATTGELPAGSFTVSHGRLVDTGSGEPIAGLDHLVLRLEVMPERDDWRFPEWDVLIGQAQEAQLLGQADRFQQIRADVLTRVVLSADLTPDDRRRVARLIRDELDSFSLGAAGEERTVTVGGLVETHGLPDAMTVRDLDMAALLIHAE